ncbi:hypothetical protein KOR42_48870 [Thalassoglobus neptunius]|uniref:Uncharacterized protein n=1 Tax=Thalassoglobus neptunius TaxID=1938619 RepID=A0A5C5VT44_9PLAN|nr:hypothetical protein KOR42_48870 [Thalassoglobus neptunius]
MNLSNDRLKHFGDENWQFLCLREQLKLSAVSGWKNGPHALKSINLSVVEPASQAFVENCEGWGQSSFHENLVGEISEQDTFNSFFEST